MTNYFWRRILIHGSAPSNNERTVFCINERLNELKRKLKRQAS